MHWRGLSLAGNLGPAGFCSRYGPHTHELVNKALFFEIHIQVGEGGPRREEREGVESEEGPAMKVRRGQEEMVSP